MAKLQTAGKYFGNCIARNIGAADMTGTAVGQFVITGGPIRVVSMGFWVKTAVAAGANTVKVRFTPLDGSIGDLTSTVDTDAAVLNTVWYVTSTIGDAPAATSAVGKLTAADTGFDMDQSGTIFWLFPGTVSLTWSGGPPATGDLQFFMEYRPMSSLAGVALA